MFRGVRVTRRLRSVLMASAAALVLVVSPIGQASASAADGGYGYVYLDRFRVPHFAAHVPRSALANSNKNRAVAVEACGAYLGNRLGLRWWLWWAPAPVCDSAMSVLGFNKFELCDIYFDIPLTSNWLRGTSIWGSCS